MALRLSLDGLRTTSVEPVNDNVAEKAVPIATAVEGSDRVHSRDADNPRAVPESESAGAVTDSGTVGNGVHAITRTTNYWFNRELYQIENDAKQYAADWASKGLPRHDVQRSTALEVEQVIAGRCVELFRQWLDRVRTKMQDAIVAGCQEIGEQLGRMRTTTTRLEAIHSVAESTERELRDLRRAAEQERVAPVGYKRLLPPAWFWGFALPFSLVELVANYPVFRLLLPMNSALALLAKSAAVSAEDNAWTAGPIVALKDMLLHVEALVVATVAVLIIIALGKTCGGAIRPLAALRESEQPLACTTIRAHRRQNWILAGGSALGIAAVLCFLYLARAQIADTARSRVSADEKGLGRAQAHQDSVSADLMQAVGATQRVTEARRALDQHQDDLAYASTVQSNNFPIFLLNLGLVIATAMLGFAAKTENLTDHRGEHPAVATLSTRLDALRAECLQQTQDARDASSRVRAGISRVHHLLRSNPLWEWRAKQERLDGVIPLFRGENARLRGLDPASVLAFHLPAAIDLPIVDEHSEFHEPEEFGGLQAEFAELRDALGVLTNRIVPTTPSPVAA